MLDVPNNLHWVTIQLITHQKVDDILAHVLSVHWCRESEGGSTCNCTSVLVPETWLLRWGAGGGWGFVLRLGASWVSRTNGLIYSISCSILCRLTPLPSRSLSKATQDGSTPSDDHPVSASYPMWAMCLEEPDLRTWDHGFVNFAFAQCAFLFLGTPFSTVARSFFRIYSSEKLFGFWFVSVDKTNHALLCAKKC